MFCIILILALFNLEKNCIVKINTFNHVFAEVLSQKNFKDYLHSVVYFFKKHSFAECNYKIYNKKLLAVILTFQEWCMKLEDSLSTIQVLSDHKNLE